MTVQNAGPTLSEQQTEAPSIGHTPVCKALWRQLQANGFQVWRELEKCGYAETLMQEVATTYPGQALRRAPGELYQLCAEQGVDAYELLCMLQRVQSVTGNLSSSARDAVLAMSLVACERCIREETSNLLSEQGDMARGLALAVDTAISAYLIAAARLQLGVRLEFKDQRLHAPGLLDSIAPPVEYRHLDRVDQVKASLLALDQGFKTAKPTSLPSDRFIKRSLLPNLNRQGIDVVFAVRIDDTQHHLSDPAVRERIYHDLQLVTVQYGIDSGTKSELNELMTDVRLMIHSLYLRHQAQYVQQEEAPMKSDQNAGSTFNFYAPVGKVGQGDGDRVAQANAPGSQAAAGDIRNADTQALDALLRAFLDLARQHAKPGDFQQLEARVADIQQAAAEPGNSPTKARWLKSALDHMESFTKGVENGEKLLDKFTALKAWLLEHIDGLSQLFQ